MILKRRLAASAAALAAMAAVPVTSAGAATIPVGDPGLLSASCPANYSGPTNPATGCPWYVMSYTAGPTAAH